MVTMKYNNILKTHTNQSVGAPQSFLKGQRDSKTSEIHCFLIVKLYLYCLLNFTINYFYYYLCVHLFYFLPTAIYFMFLISLISIIHFLWVDYIHSICTILMVIMNLVGFFQLIFCFQNWLYRGQCSKQWQIKQIKIL